MDQLNAACQGFNLIKGHRSLVAMDYNERKLLILETLAELPEADANEICEMLGNVTLHTVGMALLHYQRQGLLNRIKIRGSYSYWLTEKGLERLIYLTNVEQQ